jgi:peroxisomal membrane protein 2
MSPAPLLQPLRGAAPWRRLAPVATSAPPAPETAPPPAPPPPSPFATLGDEDGPFFCAPEEPKAPAPPPTLLRLAWARYQQQLRAKPLLPKALTSALIAALSDAIAQAVSSSARPSYSSSSSSSFWFRYDPRRTLKMALLGLVWSGPSAHFWQAFLQRRLPAPAPGSGQAAALKNAARKVAVDQLTYGPLCNLVFMLYTSSSWPAPGAFLQVQRNGWRVWPLASLVNYRFVPLELRVLFVNLVALGWTTYLNVKARS